MYNGKLLESLKSDAFSKAPIGHNQRSKERKSKGELHRRTIVQKWVETGKSKNPSSLTFFHLPIMKTQKPCFVFLVCSNLRQFRRQQLPVTGCFVT
ncbi:hypothetical protein GQ457_05G002860 [Hibiscus cannabinus]